MSVCVVAVCAWGVSSGCVCERMCVCWCDCFREWVQVSVACVNVCVWLGGACCVRMYLSWVHSESRTPRLCPLLPHAMPGGVLGMGQRDGTFRGQVKALPQGVFTPLRQELHGTFHLVSHLHLPQGVPSVMLLVVS